MRKSTLPISTCKVCQKSISASHLLDWVHGRMVICHRCYLQFEFHQQYFKIGPFSGESLYDYGAVFQERLRRFKTLKDYEYASIFLHYHRWYLRLKYQGYTLVPAPSHPNDDQQRGFETIPSLFAQVRLPLTKLFYKKHHYKQSLQTLQQRHHIQAVIQIHAQMKIPRKILLIDDVMTSGETMKAMIQFLERQENTTIKILVLSQTKQGNLARQSQGKMLK